MSLPGSAYAGGGGRLALKDALRERGIEGPAIEFYRASDISPSCRDVLDRLPNGCEHTGADMLDRFRPDALAMLKLMLAEAELNLELQLAEDKNAAGGNAISITLECGRDFLRRAWNAIRDEAVLQPMMRCYKHGGLCSPFPSASARAGKLMMAVGGNTCTPWSRMGRRRGWIHEASLCFLLWMREICEHKPNVVVQECTTDFDAEMMHELMSADFKAFTVCTDPREQGHPRSRPRKYTLMVLRFAVEFLDWSKAAYKRVCHDKPPGDASLYFSASDGALFRYKKMLAKRRHMPASLGEIPVPWATLISCSWRRRLDKYQALAEKSRRLRAKPNAFVVADLQQEPTFAGEASTHVPCLVRNSALYGWMVQEGLDGAHSRPLMPAEHLVVQGLPIFLPDHPNFQHMSKAFKCLASNSNMTEARIRELAGNGMNAAQVGAAILFGVCGCLW